jgi:hypothetical protein
LLIDLERKPRAGSYLFFLILIAAVIFVIHAPLFHVPFFWDELGQFVPASLDLFQLGRWIPVTTVPNIHPPGLMAYLSLVWHLTGFSIETTRAAMLALASVGAFLTFLLAIRLGRGTSGFPAFTALIFLCLSPLFFAQAMLAQLDMPAMVLTVLALLLFLKNQMRRCALACVVLVMVKETGIAAPMVFGFWLLLERRWKEALLFTAPLIPLGVWVIALHRATGSWAGNEAFAAYNAAYSLNPVRFGFALLRRGYYLFVGTGHFVGTVALVYAMSLTDLFATRAWRVVGLFVAVQVVMVSLFGGAVLERYLLPVLPLLYIAFAVALSAMPGTWRTAKAVALMAFLLAANFVNPIYPFPLENNLAFVSFAGLQQRAARFVQNRYGAGEEIATAFPLANALRRPDFGYVTRPVEVREIENFQAASITALAEHPPAALVIFSTVWDPLGLLEHPPVANFLHSHYGYEPQVTRDQIASRLHMHMVARWLERGQWIEVYERNGSDRGVLKM